MLSFFYCLPCNSLKPRPSRHERDRAFFPSTSFQMNVRLLSSRFASATRNKLFFFLGLTHLTRKLASSFFFSFEPIVLCGIAFACLVQEAGFPRALNDCGHFFEHLLTFLQSTITLYPMNSGLSAEEMESRSILCHRLFLLIFVFFFGRAVCSFFMVISLLEPQLRQVRRRPPT